MSDGRRCGAWYRAGGCILPRRHEGAHRNETQMELDRLRAEHNAHAALAAEHARLREVMLDVADVCAREGDVNEGTAGNQLLEAAARLRDAAQAPSAAAGTIGAEQQAATLEEQR